MQVVITPSACIAPGRHGQLRPAMVVRRRRIRSSARDREVISLGVPGRVLDIDPNIGHRQRWRDY